MSENTPPRGTSPEQAGTLAEVIHALKDLNPAIAKVNAAFHAAMDTGFFAGGQLPAESNEMSVLGMLSMLDQVRCDLLRMVLVPLGAAVLPRLLDPDEVDKPE